MAAPDSDLVRLSVLSCDRSQCAELGGSAISSPVFLCSWSEVLMFLGVEALQAFVVVDVEVLLHRELLENSNIFKKKNSWLLEANIQITVLVFSSEGMHLWLNLHSAVLVFCLQLLDPFQAAFQEKWSSFGAVKCMLPKGWSAVSALLQKLRSSILFILLRSDSDCIIFLFFLSWIWYLKKLLL